MTAKELRQAAHTFHAHSVNRAVLLERAAVVDHLLAVAAMAAESGQGEISRVFIESAKVVAHCEHLV